MSNDGHRARLKERFLGTAGAGVADYELLELALTFAIPRRDVKPLAKALLAKFGTLNSVLTAPVEELHAVHGLGPASVVLLQVCQQLALRVRRAGLGDKPLLDNRLTLLDYLYTRYASSPREEVHGLFLNNQLRLVAEETLFTGTLNEVSISPRDILKRTLAHNAAGLILAHNHPAGAPTPSPADDALTAQLAEAAKALGVTLHDHIIVGAEAHYSYKGAGKL
jgi:DNA repair protein RadC